eukprot:GHVU01074895.1.p3 GENE.GHVU01074895.1~~GHVU01074895.1.p3  ORF type:complete len:111 (-),score=11.06 GHVU01074895.1:1141-1473(-)
MHLGFLFVPSLCCCCCCCCGLCCACWIYAQGHMFCIGRSLTTGHDDVVVWNGIHHKTSLYGGPAFHGYPDESYLDRLLEELHHKGVRATERDEGEARMQCSRFSRSASGE